MGYLLAVIKALVSGSTTIFNKNYMTGTKDVKSNFDIYMLVVYPLATIYYFLLAKCSVPLNFITFIFAFINAFLSIASNVCGMVGYNYATVTYLTVFSSSGSTVVLFIYELFFTDEVFSICTVLSVAARLLAVCVPLAFSRGEKGMTKKGFLICIVYFLVAGISGIISRMYVDNPNVMSTASLCFWINVFIMPITFGEILIKALRSGNGLKTIADDAKRIKPKYYLTIIVGMVLSNLMVLVGYEIVKLIGGTVSTVIQGSLGMVIAALISALVYKEGVSRQSVISVVLSVAAVVLSVF